MYKFLSSLKTLEITKDDELTSNGDCIVGVSANISCVDLPEKMKKKIQNPKTKITFSIRAGGKKFTIQGNGSKSYSVYNSPVCCLRCRCHFSFNWPRGNRAR